MIDSKLIKDKETCYFFGWIQHKKHGDIHLYYNNECLGVFNTFEDMYNTEVGLRYKKRLTENR